MSIRNCKPAVLFLSISLLLLFTACSPKDADQQFEAFSTTMFQTELSQNTLNLHYTLSNPAAYGITDYGITLGNISNDTLENNNQAISSYQKQLEKIPYEELSVDNQLTYDILHSYFETEEKGMDFLYYPELLSSTIGTQAQLPILMAEYPFQKRKDIEVYLQLLATVDQYYDSILSYEQEKSKRGLFMADFAVDHIVEQCEDFLADKEEHYLITTFNEKVKNFEGLTEEEVEFYQSQNLLAVLEHVFPAYEHLIQGLTELKGTGKNQGGLYYLPNGREYYQYLVESSTGSSKSVEELIALLEGKLTSDLEEMVKLLEEHPDILNAETAVSESKATPEVILAELKDAIKKDFPDPPLVDYTVKYVPDSLKDHISPAFYLTPQLDNLNHNTIYINPAFPFPYIDLFTTLAHEGYPGHLYQTIYSGSQNHNPVRSLLNFGGFVEGWATYTEMYSYSLTPLNPAVGTLLQLDNSFSLCLYARTDLGIHGEGWTLSDTTDFLSTYGITDSTVITTIYETMIEEPANYLKYCIGYLEISALRTETEAKLGNSFDLKEFHKHLLTIGPASFDVVRSWLNRLYIK